MYQQLYSLHSKSLFTYSDVLCQPFPAPRSRMCLSLYVCYEHWNTQAVLGFPASIALWSHAGWFCSPHAQDLDLLHISHFSSLVLVCLCGSAVAWKGPWLSAVWLPLPLDPNPNSLMFAVYPTVEICINSGLPNNEWKLCVLQESSANPSLQVSKFPNF